MKSEQSVVNWLAYTIRPEEVRGVRWPAMWGNGQLQCFADLERPCVNQVVCFGLTEQEALDYQREQHMIPAVNDDETGKKYLLDRPVASRAKEATCSFRPDRQPWRYEFDNLVVEAALIFPRTTPGYLLRVRLEPLDGNTTKRWRVYHQLRAHAGNVRCWQPKPSRTLQGAKPGSETRTSSARPSDPLRTRLVSTWESTTITPTMS
jgi:hypothetical protein